MGNHKHSYGKSQTFLREITNTFTGNHKHFKRTLIKCYLLSIIIIYLFISLSDVDLCAANPLRPKTYKCQWTEAALRQRKALEPGSRTNVGVSQAST